MTRSIQLALAIALVVSVVVPIGAAGVAAAEEERQCSTEVSHDGFLTDEAVLEEYNQSGSASDVEHNTRLTIEETSAFYRLQAENPNSYCVHITAEVSAEILPPTNLGTVESNNGNTKAEWIDIHDFDQQEAHTEISFVMPSNSTVLFAPSKPTVLLPAWRDSRKHDAEGIIKTVSEWLGDGDLEKRTYTFTADGSPSVTVPLVNDENDEQRIDDWNAVYRTSKSEPWAPVDRNSDDPVFYQEVDDGEKIRFYFNDETAEVEFKANPTVPDKAIAEYRSFRRSLHDLGDFWPFGMVVPISGVVTW